VSVRSRIHARAHVHGLQGHARVSRQRRAALYMAVFSAVRTVVWVLAMLLVAAYYSGLRGAFLHSFIHLSSSVLWVALISYYCNASTDAANLAASISALFAADSHHDAEAARRAVDTDFGQLEGDIARLADLQPGPEARELAASIRAKLTAA
jgi:hypothetical protein